MEYRITSLYFDDCHLSCYYENENGNDPRQKWRIRIYNHSSDKIFLEKKQKVKGMTRKERCLLEKTEALKLIHGDYNFASDKWPLKEFLIIARTRAFSPSVITEYDRIPYVYPIGNVRITLDRNISSSMDFDRFFDDRITVRPVLARGMHLLEVKYDELLPSFIFQALSMEALQRSAFSKYYLCRRYCLSQPVNKPFSYEDSAAGDEGHSDQVTVEEGQNEGSNKPDDSPNKVVGAVENSGEGHGSQAGEGNIV